MERSADWMAQAKRDLENARYEREGAFFEWAAFAAQQAAEKALKAAYQRLGGEAWGHSCLQLLDGLLEAQGTEASNLRGRARLLDRFYIPARYPNGWPQGAPRDLISEGDADEAIGAADHVIRFCEGILA